MVEDRSTARVWATTVEEVEVTAEVWVAGEQEAKKPAKAAEDRIRGIFMEVFSWEENQG